MNILLIGNGFDLAHKLPTKYKDFLEFCKKAKKIFTISSNQNAEAFYNKFLKEWNMSQDIKDLLREAYKSRKNDKTYNNDGTYNDRFTTDNDALNQLFPLIKSNSWLVYFEERPSYLGENWIDFESEISKVIQILDEVRTMIMQGKLASDIKDEYKTSIIEGIMKASKNSSIKVSKNTKAINDFISLLDNDLKQMIRALELYLTEFVGRIQNDIIVPEIKDLKVDCVLSFNYTNTFKNKYEVGKEIVCDFIHGESKISNTIDSNNMVLGIEEYLPEDRKDKEFAFLSFKKFYQRLLKSTDNAYLDWIDEIKGGYKEYLKKEGDRTNIEYPEHTLYIFGHSLDATDKDILKLFIGNDNVQTKIYYYRKNEEDKSVLGKLITNLIGIIGQDELVRRTGGVHKTIEFIPQSIC